MFILLTERPLPVDSSGKNAIPLSALASVLRSIHMKDTGTEEEMIDRIPIYIFSDWLSAVNIQNSGTKPQMVERLSAAITLGKVPNSAPAENRLNVDKMSIHQLQSALRRRAKCITGDKGKLKQRLSDAYLQDDGILHRQKDAGGSKRSRCANEETEGGGADANRTGAHLLCMSISYHAAFILIIPSCHWQALMTA